MANPEHLQILEQGVEVWNAWRRQHRDITPELTEANLTSASLVEADLTGAVLFRAFLERAFLMGADLTSANLTSANLTNAYLTSADLLETNLTRANLTRADLSEAVLYNTTFGNTNLTAARGLETCHHHGPSTLDHRTLAKSGPLPLAFLCGCGLPDALIDYLPSLLNEPLQFYSCFISYASKDHAFAKRLHADLQDKGVRCWFAHENMQIGDPIRDTIDQQIRLREKLLIVLSSASIASVWVKDEVEAALEEERTSQERRTVLFPIKIDHAVDDTNQVWARQIKRTRHIGDFTQWNEHDAYQKAFTRLLRDLTAAQTPGAPA